MKVKFKKLHPNAVLPKKATELACGHDVVVTEIIRESPDFYICKLGFALTPPKGYKVVLVPRSSLTKTHWILQNSPGQGDEDYTGEYQLRFRAIPIDFKSQNFGYGIDYHVKDAMLYSEFPYKIGDRCGQLFIEKVVDFEFEEVEELSDSVRGTGGFGHSGN